MNQVHVVRHKVLIEGQSQRAVARALGLSRVTVRRYLDRAALVRVEQAPRARPVWEPWNSAWRRCRRSRRSGRRGNSN